MRGLSLGDARTVQREQARFRRVVGGEVVPAQCGGGPIGRVQAVGVDGRAIHVALAGTAEGRRGILRLCADDGGEGATRWLRILTEIQNRGVNDALMLVCDGGFRGLDGRWCRGRRPFCG